MDILTLNCGSSSAKYQVYDWDQKEILCKGVVERIGQPNSKIEHSAKGKEEYEAEHPCPTHKEAIGLILQTIQDPQTGAVEDLNSIGAVGHRVVHGGEKFTKSVQITPEVLQEFEEIAHLAPLHVPANILGIRGAQAVLPNVPHVAVLDTAWHQTMAPAQYMYALPYEWYEKNGVRRYGFHGTSYVYTSKRAAVLLGKKPTETNVIVAHIGNGASMCAMKNGKSFDTSMGLTPLEGLVMGSRSGDIDPAIVPHMANETGQSPKELDTTLNKKSGLMGLTGQYTDRRDVMKEAEAGSERCEMARRMEAYRIKKYLGAYTAALGRVDAIVFTAGVGEMNHWIREKSLENLESLGIKLDKEKNKLSYVRNGETCISTDDSPVKIFVIPTDEELVMTEDAYAVMKGTYDVPYRFTYSFEHVSYRNRERDRALLKQAAEKPEIKPLLMLPPEGI